MHRVRGLGLPAHVKARIVQSLHSVGLHGAEVGGIPKTGMTKIRTCARKALGKGAGLKRSAPLELMAHGGPAADRRSLRILAQSGSGTDAYLQ
eukprot:5404196-Amphidinium_carterae.1